MTVLEAYTYIGDGPPAADLGVQNDTYLDQANDVVYIRGSAAWVLSGPRAAVSVDVDVSDGVADATAAIVAAKVAAGVGGALHLPAGTYKTTAEVLFDLADMRIYGDGYKLSKIVASGANHGVRVSGSGVTIEGLTIDATATTGNHQGLRDEGVEFTGTGNRVFGNGGAIFVGAHRSSWRSNRSPVHFSGSTDCEAVYNRVVYVAGGGTETNICTADGGSHRAEIFGNRFYNTTNDNGAGNFIDGIRLAASTDCEVIGNYLYNAVRYGIITKDGCDRARIADNHVIGSGSLRADANSGLSGIQTYGSRDGVIQDNDVYHNRGFGICVNDDAGVRARDWTVKGNTVVDCEDAAFATYNSDDVAIVNNDARMCSDGIRVGEATPFGPSSPNTAHRAIVERNRLSNCAASAVYFAGSTGSVRYNRFHNCAWLTTGADWPQALVILADGATLGAQGVLVEGNEATRDGTQLGGGSFAQPAAPSAANRPTSIPRYFVRDTTSGATYPAALSGFNEVRGNRMSGIARGVLNGGHSKLQATSVAVDNQQPITEQILSFDAGGGGSGSGGGAVAADAGDCVEGVQSYAVTAAANGNETLDIAFGGYDFTQLHDDAMFELAIRVMDANLTNVQIRIAQGAGDNNAFLVGTFTPAMLEPIAAGWFRLRFCKADLTATGTATWANVTDLRLKVTAGAGGASTVKFDDFRVARGG